MSIEHLHTEFARKGLKHLQLCHGCVDIAHTSAWRSTYFACAAMASVTSTTLTAALCLLGGLFLVCLESSWAWRCCHLSPSYTTTFRLPCFSATCHHFISFHFMSSRFVSLHLVSSHFMSLHLTSFHPISFQAVRTAAADSQKLSCCLIMECCEHVANQWHASRIAGVWRKHHGNHAMFV